MRPFLFTIGSARIPSFFFFIMIATLACAFYLYARAKKNGIQPEAMLDIGIIGMLAGVLGARIFHILVEAPDYYWEKPMRVFEFWRGGFVSWGGFLALVIALPTYFKIRKLPIMIYMDYFATGAPIIKFFVRVACLLTGCCYGKPTDLPWAITFTDPNATAYYYYPNIPLHPTQIYSMIHAVLLFFLVDWYYQRSHEVKDGKAISKPGHTEGETIAILAMGWTLPRAAIIEFFRGDADRGLWFGGYVSTGQLTGGIVFLVALAVFIFLRKRAKKASPA
jgi:phosphatidylglycerol---prolipoprotein diacylglyceryl transferase